MLSDADRLLVLRREDGEGVLLRGQWPGLTAEYLSSSSLCLVYHAHLSLPPLSEQDSKTNFL